MQLYSVAGLRRSTHSSSSNLSWTRNVATALCALAFLPLVQAKQEILFTSSVTYCTPPESLLIQQFSVAYIASNSSVSFNISAASVEPNLNVSANLLLNVYGMHPVNLTIDLCSILGGALCPLPTYNFTGSTNIALPESVDVASKVPGIAYKIPDLEAFAQLTLRETNTGTLKACVQSTLSNGWSTRQVSVQWVTGGFALLALISALYHTSPLSRSLSTATSSSTSSTIRSLIAPARLIDIMTFYQFIASSALLNVDYPVVYRAYASNFAWALGFFEASSTPSSSSSSSSSPSSFSDPSSNGGENWAQHIQNAINRLRHATGGTLPDASGGSAVDLVNRKLSPYNSNTGPGAQPVSKLSQLSSLVGRYSGLDRNTRNLNGGMQAIPPMYKREDIATVTSTSSNVLQAGVPIFTNSLGISTANAFLTVWFSFLMLLAVFCMVFGLVWGGLWGLRWWKSKGGRGTGNEIGEERRTVLDDLYECFPSFLGAWGLRIALITFLPLTTFALYQWTLKDSWLALLFSILTFLSILTSILYSTYILIRLVRKNGGSGSARRALYTQTYTEEYTREPCLTALYALYAQFRVTRWWFFILPLFASFVKSIIIAFGSHSGLAQVIISLLIEIALLATLILLKPYHTRRADVFGVALAMTRVGVVSLLFAFVEEFGVQAIPRVAVGIVAGVVLSVVVLILFANVLVNIGIHVVIGERIMRWCCRSGWGRNRWGKRLGSETQGSSSSSNGSLVEKENDIIKNGENIAIRENDANDNYVPPYSREIDLGSSLNLHSSDDGVDVEANPRPRNPTPLHGSPFKHPNYNIDINRSNRSSSYLMPPSTSSSSFGVPPSSAFSSNSFQSFQSHGFKSAVSRDDSGFSSSHSAPHSAASALSSSGSASTTLGSVLPRRPAFEGLGMELDAEYVSYSGRLNSASALGSPSMPASPASPPASVAASVAAASVGHGQATRRSSLRESSERSGSRATTNEIFDDTSNDFAAINDDR